MFLTDPCKLECIPRGLRFQKGLAMLADDESFKKKWISILNMCVFDLMFLVIEKSHETMEALK